MAEKKVRKQVIEGKVAPATTPVEKKARVPKSFRPDIKDEATKVAATPAAPKPKVKKDVATPVAPAKKVAKGTVPGVPPRKLKHTHRAGKKTVTPTVEPQGKKKSKAPAEPTAEPKKLSRKELKAERDAWTRTQEQLLEKYKPTEKMGRPPAATDYRWVPYKQEGVWDGRPGIWTSKDPMAKFTDFPDDYVTDPVTHLVMKRLRKFDKNMDEVEASFVIDRKAWIEKHPDRKHPDGSDILPYEVFAVCSEADRVIACSFGEDGKSPADKLG